VEHAVRWHGEGYGRDTGICIECWDWFGRRQPRNCRKKPAPNYWLWQSDGGWDRLRIGVRCLFGSQALVALREGDHVAR
jgi:hypothetical protein